MRKNGFLLLSFLVYLCCAIGILSATLPVIFSLSTLLVQRTEKGVLLQNFIATQMLLTRDMHASIGVIISDSTIQLETSDNFFIEWRNDTDQQALFRVEGKYNQSDSEWTNAKTALIMKNCRFSVKSNIKDSSFLCTLESKNTVLSWVAYNVSGAYARAS